jgi:hypothetical protein
MRAILLVAIAAAILPCALGQTSGALTPISGKPVELAALHPARELRVEFSFKQEEPPRPQAWGFAGAYDFVRKQVSTGAITELAKSRHLYLDGYAGVVTRTNAPVAGFWLGTKRRWDVVTVGLALAVFIGNESEGKVAGAGIGLSFNFAFKT